jgi:hypothetical protein
MSLELDATTAFHLHFYCCPTITSENYSFGSDIRNIVPACWCSCIVSFQESTASKTRKGAELMENGIVIANMIPGELIYLNLPYHPGNRVDQIPPTSTSAVRTNEATNMGFPGIEVTWKAGHDDRWVSFYEVLRNGIHTPLYRGNFVQPR